MGAWGVGHFENDAAADWLFDLGSDGMSAVRAALARAASPEILQANEASEALAAAAVVASAHDGNRTGLPTRALDWLDGHQQEVTADDVALAERAVARVETNSELSVLWREAASAGWSALVQELSHRLESATEPSD
jgi:hypothetical protein